MLATKTKILEYEKRIKTLEESEKNLKRSILEYKKKLSALSSVMFERDLYKGVAISTTAAKNCSELYESVADTLSTSLGALYCGFFKFNTSHSRFEYAGGKGYKGGIMPAIPVVGSLMGEAIFKNEPIFKDSLSEVSEFIRLGQEPQEYNIILYPIFVMGEEFGVLRIANIQRDNLAELKLELNSAVLILLSALEKLLLHEKNDRVVKALNAGFTIARQLENSLAEKDILRSICIQIPRIIDLEKFILVKFNGGEIDILYSSPKNWYVRGNKQSEHIFIRNVIEKFPAVAALVKNINIDKSISIPGPGRSLIIEPLMVNKTLYGAFLVIGKKVNEFGEDEKNLLGLIATQTSLTLDRARYFRRQENLASIDGLTGLLNHRMFQEELRKEISRSLRYSRPLAILMFDIDFFKKFNDTYGHQTGDDVLRMVASNMKKLVRKTDGAFRYGGEEFMILLPETSARQAVFFGERLRKSIESDRSVSNLSVTISIGITEYKKDESPESFIERVDMLLYKSKEDGRNRITLS